MALQLQKWESDLKKYDVSFKVWPSKRKFSGRSRTTRRDGLQVRPLGSHGWHVQRNFESCQKLMKQISQSRIETLDQVTSQETLLKLCCTLAHWCSKWRNLFGKHRNFSFYLNLWNIAIFWPFLMVLKVWVRKYGTSLICKFWGFLMIIWGGGEG